MLVAVFAIMPCPRKAARTDLRTGMMMDFEFEKTG